jgi:hypothetical protein
MKKFEKFLFFYSIVAVTALFISLGVFSPGSLSLISGTILLPIVFYFWIRFTSPEAVDAEKWSLRFLISIVVLSALGILGYRLSQIKPSTPPQNTNVESTTLPTPTPTVSKNSTASGETVADLLSETPIPLQEITGKPGVKVIDVYQDPLPASKKIDSLDGTAKYLYLEKQRNWYKIVLTESMSGWVSASQVVEVQ